MNNYKNIQDTLKTNTWLKQQGLNPNTCTNPDLEANFIRAKAATHNLLRIGTQLLSTQEQKQLEQFRSTSQATPRQIFQILNLNKRIKRQLYKQV